MSLSLHTRLATFACKDLAANCPKTTGGTIDWLHHAGFWLAELSAQPASPDQVWALVGVMAHPYAWTMGMTWPDACQVLKEHMKLHQLTRQS